MREGKLGIRNIGEVQKTFFMKFVWRLMSADNLGTKLFIAKYDKSGHLSRLSLMPTRFRFWIEIIKVIQEAYVNCFIKVRDGKSSFCFDRWLNTGPLSKRIPMISNPKIKNSQMLELQSMG